MIKYFNIKTIKTILAILILYFSLNIIYGCSNSNKNINKKTTHSSFAENKKIAKKNNPTGNNIWMKNLAFVPKIKTIKVGTTITWVNKDVAMHTVHTGTPEKPLSMIDSGTLGKDDKYSFTFKKKGTYKYFCTTHPTIMQGIVVVR